MSRYIDADDVDKVIRLCRYNGHYISVEYDKNLHGFIACFPTADVVSKEKYDELNERYHRLLESANILSNVVREYERREDERLN